MISKKTAAIGIVVIIIMTAFFSSFITLKINEYLFINEGNAITADEYTEMRDFYKKFNQIREYVEKDYIEEPDREELLNGAIKGMVSALNDPYTYYLTPEEYKNFIAGLRGSYAGVGLKVTIAEDNRVTVVQVFKDTPAAKAKIKAGDKIVGIDGEPLTGMNLDQVVSKMKGEPGTEVTITILRDDKTFEVNINREVIDLPDLEYKMLNDEIGYIWLYRFDEGSAKNFIKALDKLKEQGMKGLVLDLRNNPGGILSECEKIADELLPEGLILYSEDRNGKREEYKSDKAYLNLPMAVIVNGESASASEVLTGAVQDHNVGTIVGTTTFGKALVQTLKGPFKEGDMLKITTSKYFTPNGRDINKKGIEPDVVVEVSEEANKFFEENIGEPLPLELDEQLKEAIKEVEKLMAP